MSWAEYHVVSADDPRTETGSRSLSSDDPEMQAAARDGYAYNPPFHDSVVWDLALVPRRHDDRICPERCCLTPGVTDQRGSRVWWTTRGAECMREEETGTSFNWWARWDLTHQVFRTI